MTKKIYFIDLPKKIGQSVVLYGWVYSKREHGKINFIDLRDHTALVQVVGDEQLKTLTLESVVRITGEVQAREPKYINEKLSTGKIEIVAKKIEVITKAQTLPFPIDNDGYKINEELRLKYRYLDLRRSRLLQNLIYKDQVITFIRQYLKTEKFLEIDTPILTKTTPEGARDFLVPSRKQKGKFYALPQSPQQYKQLLMVAGIERYFQIARCFRDEDPRKDRAYGGFTQLDLEMAFVEQNDILKLTEELFTNLVKTVFPNKKITQSPWPRIPYAEAIKKYSSDRPDLRKNKKDKDELAFAFIVNFPLFAKQTQEDFYHGSGKAQFAPSHHMFTAPHPDDLELLNQDPLKTRGLQHDFILNGYEIGGGSIRIHKLETEVKIFDLIGFTEKQKKQFDHMLEAFTYGVPPHGGIAPGIDRFLFVLLGEPSIREVIAFPATSGGTTAVMNAPSKATPEQLLELGIKINEKK